MNIKKNIQINKDISEDIIEELKYENGKMEKLIKRIQKITISINK